MVVRFAIWVSISLEEIPRSQFLVAVGANEVFGVPCFAQSCDDLPNNGFVASWAAAFLGRVNSLFAHVCLQAVKHAVQLCRAFLPASRGFGVGRLDRWRNLTVQTSTQIRRGKITRERNGVSLKFSVFWGELWNFQVPKQKLVLASVWRFSTAVHPLTRFLNSPLWRLLLPLIPLFWYKPKKGAPYTIPEHTHGLTVVEYTRTPPHKNCLLTITDTLTSYISHLAILSSQKSLNFNVEEFICKVLVEKENPRSSQ